MRLLVWSRRDVTKVDKHGVALADEPQEPFCPAGPGRMVRRQCIGGVPFYLVQQGKVA
jgi:hypothetical protein